MRASIRNLGPVREADISIRPLTILIGKNNTGKTWTAYLAAAALSRFGLDRFLEAYIHKRFSYDEVDGVLERVAEDGSASIDLLKFLDANGSRFLNDLASLAPEWMGEFLGTEGEGFHDLQLHLDPQDTMDKWKENVRDRVTMGGLRIGPKDLGLRAHKDKNKSAMEFYTIDRDSESDLLTSETVRSFVAEGIFLALHRSIFPKVVFLPPERIAYAALALSMPYNVTAKEDTQHPGARPVRLSYPIRDFIGMLVWVKNRDRAELERRIKLSEKNRSISNCLDAAKILETLLGGEIRLVSSEASSDLKEKKVVFLPEGSGKTLEITATASLVKALSPLYLYLKYLAEPGDLLVIDEPEMNLHPEAQAKITELLSLLANSGISVIATTHSPYITDHLINIMKAAEMERKEAMAEKFYLKTSASFISRENVSVYRFEDGTAVNALSEDGMIDAGTFGDVSDRVSQLYFEL